MKRIALAAALALSLAACQSEPAEPEAMTQPAPEAQAPAPQPELSQTELDAALWDAATEGAGDPQQITALINQGANPSQRKEFLGEEIPLLQQAAREGSAETMQALIVGGASWDGLTQEQKNWALLDSTCTGSAYTVEALIKAGADPAWTNEFGESAATMLSPEYLGSTCNPIDPAATREVLQQAGANLSEAPATEPGNPLLEALGEVRLGEAAT